YEQRNLGDESLIVVRDEESVKEAVKEKASFKGKRTLVFTDLIKEEIDQSSFEYRLMNTSIIDRLSDEVDNFHVFSTEMEAGKKQSHKSRYIYGLGPCFDREGVKIPFLSSGKGFKVKTFPAERVGLLAIPDLGKKFSNVLRRKGIEDRAALKECEPEELMKQEGVGPYRCTKWISSAEAIEEGSVYRIQENDLEGKHRIYIDIETDSLRPKIVWHIGLYDDVEEKYLSFLEKEPDKKGRIIKRFGSYLEKHGEPETVLLAWYGSGFDFKVLDDFFEKYGQEFLKTWRRTEKVDLMRWVKKHAVTSCRTSKLDDVAGCLGYERGKESMELSGKEVARIYSDHMIGRGGEPDWTSLKEYAKDDVISLKFIYDEISQAPMKYDLKEMKKRYRRNCF
ncbi:MAG: ribonuclease H-like domain-containing protein, partial [Candidatus Natronoplasma sp.]